MDDGWKPFVVGSITSCMAWWLWCVNPWQGYNLFNEHLGTLNYLVTYLGVVVGFFGYAIFKKSKTDETWTSYKILICLFASVFCVVIPSILDGFFPKH